MIVLENAGKTWGKNLKQKLGSKFTCLMKSPVCLDLAPFHYFPKVKLPSWIYIHVIRFFFLDMLFALILYRCHIYKLADFCQSVAFLKDGDHALWGKTVVSPVPPVPDGVLLNEAVSLRNRWQDRDGRGLLDFLCCLCSACWGGVSPAPPLLCVYYKCAKCPNY